MGKKLFIVESPGKIKKIQGFLGQEYIVKASVGHIRDLPVKEIGIKPPDYKPVYKVTKPDVVANLRKAAKSCDEIILATDLDREGEAIAWHLKQVLKVKNPKRIVYSEISKSAVLSALKNARPVNMPLVMAQEARRVIDRLVGYRISGPVSKLLKSKASVGRVQTPAVVLVVERERQIADFVPQDHYGVLAELPGNWSAIWSFKDIVPKGQKYFQDKAFAQKVQRETDKLKIVSMTKNLKPRNPPAPFTTSTLQQATSSQLRIKPKQTMALAQKLYEDGLITYMRTDSPNLSNEAIQMIWAELRDMGLDTYIPAQARTWKSKADAQEAHECIRPTHLSDKLPSQISGDHLRLYTLIWQRTMAAQMKPELSDVTDVNLVTSKKIFSDDGTINALQTFIAQGKIVKFDGWTKIYTDAGKKNSDQVLPAIAQGDIITPERIVLQEKKTQPPGRYTEATLIKKLEDEGIGRPSTYASIIETLFRRKYMTEQKRKLYATDIAGRLVDSLVGKFHFAQLDYTKQVEKGLDLIAQGKEGYTTLVSKIDQQLTAELQNIGFGEWVPDSCEIDKTHSCPVEGCDGFLQQRQGKKGSFWGCSNYPKCKETRPDADGVPGEREVYTGKTYPCPVCQKPMRLLNGKNGPFWGCTGFPKCKTIVNDLNGHLEPVHLCPDCGKPLRRNKAKRGPNAGNYFWGCTGYPKCKNIFSECNGSPEL